LRYVAEEDFEAFAGKQDRSERRRVIRELMKSANISNGDVRTVRSKLNKVFPDGFFARRQAFSKDGVYGKWLLEQRILIVINGVAFVHAGLSAQLLELDPAEINRVGIDELRDYLGAEAVLLESGAIHPEVVWIRQVARLQRLTQGTASTEDHEAAETMLRVIDGMMFSQEGPLWYRGTAMHPIEDEGEVVEKLLEHVGATTLVIGHTPTHTGRISTRLGGAVIQADTGMLTAHYGGQPSTVEFKDHLIFERYLGFEPKPLAAQQWEFAAGMFENDQEIEAFLATAPVAFIGELGSGSTRPMVVALGDNGRRARAIFKTHSSKSTARVEHSDVAFEQSYLHEVAAYDIDRLLKLGMVPPTVVREIDGVEGSLQLYVEGAVNETNRQQEHLEPPDRQAFEWQLDRARAFDWLILNPERAPDNVLYTSDGKVHLIDHAAAFAPPVLAGPSRSTRRPRIDEDLATRIDGLDLEELRVVLAGLLEEPELEALLIRIAGAQRE
jgi:hypothetical protein